MQMASFSPVDSVGFLPTFHGGLNLIADKHMLDNTELVECVNFDPNPGHLEKRKGYTVEAVIGTNPVKRLIYARWWDGSTTKLVTSGTNLKKWDSTTVYSTLATAKIGHEQYQNKLLVLDGGGAAGGYYHYDGVTFAQVPVPPDTGAALDAVRRCDVVTEYLDRIWVAGDPQSPHSLYYSQTGRYDYFKSTDMVVNLLGRKGEKINRLVRYQNALVVFFPSDVWVIWDDPLAAGAEIFRLAVPWGAIAPMSVALADNMLIYSAVDGVYGIHTLDKANLSAVRLTEWARGGGGITPLIKSLINPQNAVGIYHLGRYYLACQRVAASNANDTVLVCDLRYGDPARGKLGSWWVYDGWYVDSWLVDPVTGDLYYGDAKTGRVNKALQGYSDGGNGYTARATTKFWDLDGALSYKKTRTFHIVTAPDADAHAQADLNVLLKTESDVTHLPLGGVATLDALVWGAGRWGEKYWGGAPVIYHMTPYKRRARWFQAEISSSGNDQSFIVNGIGFTFRAKPVK